MNNIRRKQSLRLFSAPQPLSVLFVLMLIALPVSTFTLLGTLNRDTVHTLLENVLDTASDSYRRSSVLRYRQEAGQNAAEQSHQKLLAIGRQRRSIRLEIAALEQFVVDLKMQHGIDVSDALHAAAMVEKERDAIGGFMRYLSARGMLGGSQGDSLRERVRRSLVFGPFQQNDNGRILAAARARLFSFLVSASEVPVHLAALRERHEELSKEYAKALHAEEKALHASRLSEAELRSIKQTMKEVHQSILALQSELARIDARLQRESERALIEKGLMSPKPGAHADGKLPASTIGFSWPVIGALSAGFHLESYEKFFGIPHEGIDIVVPMRTPVHAAADGVVFLVRDGGLGYSYILIGHRGTFATLYGHLSGFSVATGDSVRAGQVIGFSGGQPGSPGAGLMTTGAHLHFEVIENGVNVDPLSVLP